MNALLWVLQIALALLSFAGGAYKVFKFDEIAKMPQMGALSRGGWGALGMFEMVCAVLLVVPLAAKWMPLLTPLAAAAIALESLALAGLYARYSLKLTATNPLVWVVLTGLMAAVVAYGRYALSPPA
jgi:DoxX-like protein